MPPAESKAQLDATIDSLLGGKLAAWPDWRCVATDASAARACNAPATWQALPLKSSTTFWTYCDHHKPEHAERIPENARFTIVRLELQVALAGPPGDLRAAADAAVRRATYALQDVGALVTGIRLRGRKARLAEPAAAVGRLELAGRPEPLPGERSRPTGARNWFRDRPWWRRRTG